VRPSWADFRIPPINLWVMPPMPAAAQIKPPHRSMRAPQPNQTQQQIARLLAARGGYHGH